MRNGFLGALVLLLAASTAWAQLPFHRPPPGCENGPDYHSWARFDYLVWWLKDAPLPVPLAATAALDTPGATVLYGGQEQDYGAFHGGRVVAGFWVDCEGILGFEGSGFTTERRSSPFRSTGLAADTPVVVPVLNADLSTNFLEISVPGTFTGTLVIDNSIRFWGYNADTLLTVGRSSNWELQLLSGFRYLNLTEQLHLAAATTEIATGASVVLNDAFRTRNDFYGGEIGFRTRFNGPIAFLELGAKVAFGATRQQVNISGQGTLTDGGGATAAAFGLFAQPSNIGPHERTEFAVIPEAHLRVGVELSSHLKVSLGYDFLYINDAVRPGTHIDPVVDLGGVRPAFTFDSTDFYAHGFSLGLEIRY
jgi:hypothetical protein